MTNTPQNIEFIVHEKLAASDLNDLWSRAYGKKFDVPFDRILRQSLTWVTARRDGVIQGFINVAWDGFVHAFVVDRCAVDDLDGGLRATLMVEAVRAIERDHPSVFKVHVECTDEEREDLESMGYADVIGGIVTLER